MLAGFAELILKQNDAHEIRGSCYVKQISFFEVHRACRRQVEIGETKRNLPAVSSEELPAETKLLSISLPFTPRRA